jgi:hypothetical protein
MKEIIFDALTAKEVSERLRVIRENQTAVNMVALTVARIHGAAPTDMVQLNEGATGIWVGSVEPENMAGPVDMPEASSEVTPSTPLKGGQKAQK